MHHRGLLFAFFALSSFLAAASARAVETIHLLALRVEFPKEDPDDFTTGGNGLFDMRSGAEALAAAGEAGFRYPFDLPPHDGRFLENHLTALRNYLETASQGRTTITWEVFPPHPLPAYKAPQTLASYGSGGSVAEQTRNWVRFLKDALAVSQNDVGSLGRFQSFLVFHASVSLQGTLSAELPALVLTSQEIASSGIPIPPEVQTAWLIPQQIQQPGGVIGLNGAFAKTFLASRGLPVLSNTRTGGAAVGAWTLMDVGSDNFIQRPRTGSSSDTIRVLGFVPCLPSAWEQMRLGWLAPETVRSDTTLLLAGLAAETSLPRALKVPITEDEYLLLELRHSAVETDRYHPAIEYSDGDTSGVWLKPENGLYDAYVPGSGVIVYHVNEARIRQWEPTNSINAQPDRPGIMVVEADGYRYIGVTNLLGHPRANEGIGSRNDPFPVTGERILYPDGEPAPGHPAVITANGSPGGVAISFSPAGTARDTVAVTVRWRTADTPARKGRFIGSAVVGGVAVRRVPLDGVERNLIAVAGSDWNLWAFTDSLEPVGNANGLIGRFWGDVTRKPVIEADGSVLVVGLTTNTRYRYANGAWDGGTPVVQTPPVPSTMTCHLLRDVRKSDITVTGSGTITADSYARFGYLPEDPPPPRVVWSATTDSLIAPLSLGDVDRDGFPDILAVSRRSVDVFSRSGTRTITYTLGRADSTEEFAGSALSTGAGNTIVAGKKGLSVFSGLMRRHPAATIPLPAAATGSPALYAVPDEGIHAVVGTADGWLLDIPVSQGDSVIWGQMWGDGASSFALDETGLVMPAAPAEDLMPGDRVFFYPSPVGKEEGMLRFFLSAQADVSVRIFTSMGEQVWETRVPAGETVANAENEIRWPGGTRFATGLYVARITARSADGRQGGATIPVGIVR